MKLDFDIWLQINKDSIHLLYSQLKNYQIFKQNNIDIKKFEYFCYLNSSKHIYKYNGI